MPLLNTVEGEVIHVLQVNGAGFTKCIMSNHQIRQNVWKNLSSSGSMLYLHVYPEMSVLIDYFLLSVANLSLDSVYGYKFSVFPIFINDNKSGDLIFNT